MARGLGAATRSLIAGAWLAALPVALAWKATQLAATWSQWAVALAIILLAQGALFWIGIRLWRPLAGTHSGHITGSERSNTEPRRQRVERASHARSEFLANMSHELRTPIQGILGVSELMLQKGLGAEQREYVEIVKSSSGDLLQVIEDILDFSNIEAGKLQLEATDFSLPDLLRDVIDLMEPRATAKSIELRLEVAPGAPEELRGDPLRLRQILLNLVGNAIKLTSEGHIIVAVERTPTASRLEVGFAVQDTGVGIEPGMRESLFLPFRQADGPASREHGGTGLGLAITHRVVEHLGGTIAVDTTPGVGSTFFVNLPFDTPQTTSLSPRLAPAPSRAPRSRRARRVLIVEDEAVNRMVAIRLLEHLGYRAEAVADGRAALEALERGRFDLALMDCQMPELDGYETTRQIRRHEADAQRLPIIAVTAHALRGDREKCLAAGMDDYLAKPFREAELAEVVARWLQQDATTPRSSASADALDPATLDTLLRLDREAQNDFLSRAIQDFLKQESPKLAEMHRALGTDDTRNLMEAAHSLCGSAGSLGAFHLSKLCGELVDLAQYRTLNECRIRLRDVEREFERTVGELRKILGEPRETGSRRRSHRSA